MRLESSAGPGHIGPKHNRGAQILFSENRKPFEDFFFSFIFISWRLITLQYRSGFCHTLT